MRDLPPLAGLPAQLRDVLVRWDPLGVMPDAPRDEYDDLIPGLQVLLAQRPNAKRVRSFLTDRMVAWYGMPATTVTARVVSDLVALANGRDA